MSKSDLPIATADPSLLARSRLLAGIPYFLPRSFSNPLDHSHRRGESSLITMPRRLIIATRERTGFSPMCGLMTFGFQRKLNVATFCKVCVRARFSCQ